MMCSCGNEHLEDGCTGSIISPATNQYHSAFECGQLDPQPDVESISCPDCGMVGEMAGHMGCEYPQDHVNY